MLVSIFVLLIGALISAFNLASGYICGSIFGFSIALWGSIIGTLFLALGIASVVSGPLARRAKGRGLTCLFAFLAGALVFVLAFLEPKAAQEFMAADIPKDFKAMSAVLSLLFLPNFLMALIVPVTAGATMNRIAKANGPETSEPVPPKKKTEKKVKKKTDKKRQRGTLFDDVLEAEAVEDESLKVIEMEHTDAFVISTGEMKATAGTDKIEKQEAPEKVIQQQSLAPQQPEDVFRILRRNQALALFGMALGSFGGFFITTYFGGPWSVLTLVGTMLLLVSFFGAAFVVKSMVTAVVVSYFVLSGTLFVELVPSPGFFDRVYAEEQAKQEKVERDALAREEESLEVKRLTAQQVKDIFHHVAEKVRNSKDKSIALTLVIDALNDLGPAIISGEDLNSVVGNLVGESEYRGFIMPFINDIISVKRDHGGRIVVKLREHRDGSHSTIRVPREDGSALKLAITKSSLIITINKQGNSTQVDFGPVEEKKGFLGKKKYTPIKAIDVVGPVDAYLISLKVINDNNLVTLLARGQGPIGKVKEVEVAKFDKTKQANLIDRLKKKLFIFF